MFNFRIITMFFQIIEFLLSRWLIFCQIYFMRSLRRASRIERLTNVHDNKDHSGKVYGHVSDLTHALCNRLRDYIYHHNKVLKFIIYMIAVCINASSIVLLDAMFHSASAAYVIVLVTSMRSVLQLLYRSSPPDGRYGPWFKDFNHWSLPSQKETFFSGHTTCVMLAILFCDQAEFITYYIDYNIIYSLMIFNFVFIVISLIVLRIHYIIDIYGSIITCLLFYKILCI